MEKVPDLFSPEQNCRDFPCTAKKSQIRSVAFTDVPADDDLIGIECNYTWRQQYGRNAPWATDRLARDHAALTHAASGAGGRLLASGHAGGSVSWGERVAGGLGSVNEATRISILSDFKQGARAGLDDFADYTIAHGWPTAIGGTMYAVGMVGVESLPETGLEALTAIGGGPALNLLGKAKWLGRAVDDVVPDSATTQAATRARVEAALAESAAARRSSNIDEFLAKSVQVESGYNADAWVRGSLKQGDVIYALSPNRKPEFFTTLDSLQAGNFNSAYVSRILQVKEHDVYGYRPDVTGYRVIQDFNPMSGRTLANPQFGPGGGDQFLIRDYQKYLEPIVTIDLKR